MNPSRSVRGALCLALAVGIFLGGCGGQAANPVDRYTLGDEKKSCNALYAEMTQLDQDVVQKGKAKGTRDVVNVVCFVTGFFIIVPWFFIDLKGSHEIEIEAFRARKKALEIIFSEKNCTPPQVMPSESGS